MLINSSIYYNKQCITPMIICTYTCLAVPIAQLIKEIKPCRGFRGTSTGKCSKIRIFLNVI